MLDLTPDQLLSTTRAVRKRLDFDRPVPDDLIRECVGLAMQSPSGSNNMTMQFVVVRDVAKRKAIADIYRGCFAIYETLVVKGPDWKGHPMLAERCGWHLTEDDDTGEHTLAPLRRASA